MKPYQIKAYIAALLSLLQVCASAEEPEPFLALALQEVLELEITSVSKKPQTVSRSAAAVFVITGDDIRRAGAQNIPDALRLAPGLHVAQISANAWAVSARGPNGRFANKLLVMIDGRTVYSPMFSGVAWDVQDTVLADIERIEVIRGPGASLWGANAVNGVINIITKSAVATQGTLIDASTGTATQGQMSIRHGGQWEDLGHWRLYGKAVENNALTLANGQGRAMDAWKQQRLGWRADLNPNAQDAVTIQSEIYQARLANLHCSTVCCPRATCCKAPPKPCLAVTCWHGGSAICLATTPSRFKPTSTIQNVTGLHIRSCAWIPSMLTFSTVTVPSTSTTLCWARLGDKTKKAFMPPRPACLTASCSTTPLALTA